MKFQIRNRWSGETQYECELSAEVAGLSYSLQLGWAVKKAVAEKANLSAANLSAADLRDANLSAADLRYANLRAADLRDANLSAADLRDANLSAADLRYANLRAANLSAANLSAADLSDADLRAANLSAANLRDANLSAADLRYANLRAANLRAAGWIPKIENIHQAVYAAASQPDALSMDSWHQNGYCGTTHCRAGHVVVLAGPGGRVLEGVYGTAAAAALIYQASDPSLERIPDFYSGNTEALADMKRLADAESTKQASA